MNARPVLLVLVPLAPALWYFGNPTSPWVFLAGAAAVGVLADWISRATQQLSGRVGPAIGGLLNVSFGSLAEFILALFVLLQDRPDVVRAQITGSILGTSLLGLGLGAVVGGIGRDVQRFNSERAGLLSSMLILVVIALLLPAVFDATQRTAIGTPRLGTTDERLSVGVSIVLLGLYTAGLVYRLVTRRDVLAAEETPEAGPRWPLAVALAVLVAATAVIALEAELVSGALEATAGQTGMSPSFLGVIVLALIGTVSDLFAAVAFARQGDMGLVLNICIGSAIQVALVVAPLLVLVSWAMGHPMTLVFGSPLDLFAIACAAFIVNAVARDGETNWFEGVLLVGVYLLFGLAFFYAA